MLVMSLNNFQSWLVADNIISNSFSVSYFEFPWHFLVAPFFYTFLIHYLDIQKKAVKLLIFIIPFFITLCFIQLCFVIYCEEKATLAEFSIILDKYRSVEEFFSFFISFSVFGYSYYILTKKKKLFSNVLAYDNLKWLYSFFKFTFFAYITWILAIVMRFKIDFNGFIYFYYPLRVFTTLIIFILGYQAVRHLRIAKERKELRKGINQRLIVSEKQPKEEREKYKEDSKNETKNNIKNKQQFDKLDNFIRNSNKFLIPKYSLNNLSEDLNISTSSLSATINLHANKSFIDYINEMRVQQSKKILIDPKYSNYTIAAIGLESGFNSKSAFYNVFKKHTGVTPLAYKDSELNTNPS